MGLYFTWPVLVALALLWAFIGWAIAPRTDSQTNAAGGVAFLTLLVALAVAALGIHVG